MVKGLFRGEFAAEKFLLGILYRGDMRLHVNLFTTVDFRFHAIIFPGST